MKILRKNTDITINLNLDTNFNLDLGREEGLELFEDQTLNKLINPIENYETDRFQFKPYSGLTADADDLQCNIWYYFYFYNLANPATHVGGTNYIYVGITPDENVSLIKSVSKCFFRLEFYKVPNGQEPSKTNRKLAFSRNIPLVSGERVLYQDYNREVVLPIFMGSKYRNRENMYLYWFQDQSVLNGTIFTGDTFYMTARFFNAKDGSILNFGNKSIISGDPVTDSDDLYYKVVLDFTDLTYQIYNSIDQPIGYFNTPINFYEIS